MHQNIKLETSLEVNEENYARNLFGLTPVENFIMAFGSSLVENYIRETYNANGITKEKRDQYLEDIKIFREKIKKHADIRKLEETSRNDS